MSEPGVDDDNNHDDTEIKPVYEDDFTKCLKKMTTVKRPKIIRPSAIQAKLQQKTHRKTAFYLTGGRKIDAGVFKKLNEETSAPFRMPPEIDDIDYIEKFREVEKEAKIKDRLGSFANRHNYQSRLRQFKSERLYVPEITKLPGKWIHDGICIMVSTMLITRLPPPLVER